jgi:hypothetical protein
VSTLHGAMVPRMMLLLLWRCRLLLLQLKRLKV